MAENCHVKSRSGESRVCVAFPPLEPRGPKLHDRAMNSLTESIDLNGKLLIAMPGMGDPRFDHSVIFMCTHSDEGAMGLIVNKPSSDLRFDEVLDQFDIASDPEVKPIRVHFGGPVEYGRGFVLHSRDYTRDEEATMEVGSDYGMTASIEILEDIAQGLGPADCLLAMGYAGWGPGQLEGEIMRNGWLVADASRDIVFGAKDKLKWQRALEAMGINPLLLSSEGGRA